MNRSFHRSVVAVHHSARVHRQISHQVAQQQNARRQLVGRLVDRVLCVLPDALVATLGIATAARNVMLGGTVHRHIIERRQLASGGDVDVAAHRIHEALADVRFLVLPRRRDDVFELVGWVPGAGRFVVVALKFVPRARARSGEDECWVCTAFPLGQAKLRRWEAAGRLRTLS